MSGPDPEAQPSPPEGPTAETSAAASYDPEAVRAKYLAERDKRLVPGRADIRDLRPRRALRPLPGRPVHPGRSSASPVADEVDVVIVGGGIAGVLAGANLRKAGDRADPHRRPGRAASGAPGTGTATRA